MGLRSALEFLDTCDGYEDAIRKLRQAIYSRHGDDARGLSYLIAALEDAERCAAVLDSVKR